MGYYGKDTVGLSGPHFTLEVLAHGGPRVVKFIPAGTDLNLFAEAPDAVTVTEWGPYQFLGGHRLWHAPEASPRSYELDDEGVSVQADTDWLLVTGPIEAHNKIRKSIEFRIDKNRPAVRVEHRMQNHNVWPVELAAWSITQMRLGGTGILPLRVAQEEPGGLLPDRLVAFWPYSDLKDPRLHLNNDVALVDGMASQDAFKIGAFNPLGWIAYLFHPYLFIKRFTPLPGKYADYGCNAEIFVRDQFLEIETQGLMTMLSPGETLTYTEEWEVVKVEAKDALLAIGEAGLS